MTNTFKEQVTSLTKKCIWTSVAMFIGAAVVAGAGAIKADDTLEQTAREVTVKGAPEEDPALWHHAPGSRVHYLSYAETDAYVESYKGVNDACAKFWVPRCTYARDNGFGIVDDGMDPSPNAWWCNDSWPTAAAACNTAKTPAKWDSAHVAHYGILGGIPDAFYGGWSCDYNGTGNGATWAGVGNGHR